MADEKKPTAARRPRRTDAAKELLAGLLQARDKVDADSVERRKREEQALTAFAEAEVEAQGIGAEVERALAELDRQRDAVKAKAAERVAGVDGRKARALLELTEVGRSAEDVAAMTGLGVKRVRQMIRDVREVKPVTEQAPKAAKPVSGGRVEEPSGQAAGDAGVAEKDAGPAV